MPSEKLGEKWEVFSQKVQCLVHTARREYRMPEQNMLLSGSGFLKRYSKLVPFPKILNLEFLTFISSFFLSQLVKTEMH